MTRGAVKLKEAKNGECFAVCIVVSYPRDVAYVHCFQATVWNVPHSLLSIFLVTSCHHISDYILRHPPRLYVIGDSLQASSIPLSHSWDR